MNLPITARFGTVLLAGVMEILMNTGCSHGKSPEALAAQVAAAKEHAAKQIADARVEAGKDLKSATKTHGGPDDVARAKAIGEFDIAMAQADGEHTVALKECLTRPETDQAACKQQADAAYDAAKASAKDRRETRMARR